MAQQEGEAAAQQTVAEERRVVAAQMLEWRLTYQEGEGRRELGENRVVRKITGKNGRVDGYRRGKLADAVVEMGGHVHSQARKRACTGDTWVASREHPAARLHIVAPTTEEEQARQAKVRRLMGSPDRKALLVAEIQRVMEEMLPSLEAVEEREEGSESESN